jgi:phosphoribosyl 1,2-cyclic phosphodiesterase
MALYIASLNSGSNGNSYYIGNGQESVLVDAGLSCRETEKRMKRCGLSMEHVKGVFISHEHSDHIRGVEVIARRHRLPVYITRKTLHGAGLQVDKELVKPFSAYERIGVGSLTVIPFPKKHDASEPHSFLVTDGAVTIGVFTDIGTGCDHVVKNLSQCDAAFLETNYDDHMLETGSYPYHLKRRIRSDHGHLSNAQALELFTKHGRRLSCLLLSHLSKDNNDPALVESLFAPYAGSTRVVVASRYRESEVYRIDASSLGARNVTITSPQLDLFQD